jgi:AraC-like DNA-binding protein
MDLMSRAVDEMRLRRVAYERQVLRSSAATRHAEGERGLHLVLRGQARLRVDGSNWALASGDTVILPCSLAHVLEPERLHGESCELLSGLLEFEAADHPLFTVLPPVIHATPERALENARYASCLEHLKAEALSPRDGSDAMLARLTEVLFIEVMRFFTPPPGVECPVGGWFAGLGDPAVRRVLAAIHEAPGKSWSVTSLAKVARESRSAFAAHFASVMREPPMAYLGRWRMFHARSLLRRTELPLSEIAEQVGYGSAAAFSLAFSKAHGSSPGAFRSQHREHDLRGNGRSGPA